MRIYEVANENLTPVTEETTRFAVWGCDRVPGCPPYLDLSTLTYHAAGSREFCLAAKRLMETP